MKSLRIAIFTLLVIAVAIGVTAQRNNPLRKLQIANLAVSNLYVDSVDENKLVEDAIRGMLKGLDPHST